MNWLYNFSEFLLVNRVKIVKRGIVACLALLGFLMFNYLVL